MLRIKTVPLSTWLELIAAIAVLAGLLLLVVEIRENTRAAERQASLERAAALSEAFFESDELLSANEKIRQVDGRGKVEAALMERYGMSGEEATVWSRHIAQVFLHLRSDYDYGDPQQALGSMKFLLQNPDVRVVIENSWFPKGTDEFARYMQQILESVPPPD